MTNSAKEVPALRKPAPADLHAVILERGKETGAFSITRAALRVTRREVWMWQLGFHGDLGAGYAPTRGEAFEAMMAYKETYT